MNKESTFFIYLLERYADAKESTAEKILDTWNTLDLTDFIYDMYEMYHIERIENAFEDIERLEKERQNTK